MQQWYRRVFREPDEDKQLSLIIDACEAYENDLPEAIESIKPPTGRIENMQMKIPGLAAENYSRLQDLEIILQHIENHEAKIKQKKVMFYLEHYQKALSDRAATQYADVHDDVQTIRLIRMRVASVRNQFLAVSKGMEFMHFQISNLTKLRAVGLDDSTF